MARLGRLRPLDRFDLSALDEDALDDLRGKLQIGIHSDVEVTDSGSTPPPVVSQAFCSALPVRYGRVQPEHWKSFATLLLEAAYEPTLLAAVEAASRGGSNVVLLTRLGGGAFGNSDYWIHAAIRRALALASGFNLDVRLVSCGEPSPTTSALLREFQLAQARRI